MAKPLLGWVTRINWPQLVRLTGVRSRTGSNPACGYRLRFITSVFTLTSKVLPSGAARTTASVPMLPEAPTRFSTTTGRLRRSESLGPTVRAIRSMPVPGVKGTIRRKGCSPPGAGACACATPDAASRAMASQCRRVCDVKRFM